MKFKLILLMGIALILLSVSGVCAGDADNDAMLDDQITPAEDVIEEATIENNVINDGAGSFTELQDLINNNTVVDLTKDYAAAESEGRIHINSDKIINGNGHTLDGVKKAAIIEIEGGNIVFNDIVFKNGEGIDGGAVHVSAADSLTFKNTKFVSNSVFNAGGAVFIDTQHMSNATEFINCAFENNYADRFDGGAIYINSNQPVVITGSTFKSNECNGGDSGNGGAIHVTSPLNVTDSSFIENLADDDGGAIHAEALLNVVNCDFRSNKADDGYGGAIYAQTGANIIGSTFSENNAKVSGGAVMSHGPLYIADSSFKSNEAAQGGGVYCYNSVANIINTDFTENIADFSGGAAYIASTTDMNASKFINCTFKSNKVDRIISSNCFGGAVSCAYLEIYGCAFLNNSAEEDGGAIYTILVNIEDSIFSGNTAGFDGGAVYAHFGNVNATNSIFNDNKAVYEGGAIYAQDNDVDDSEGNVNLKNCTFKYNSVSDTSITQAYGGAVSAEQNVRVDSSTFIGNTALTDGGAIFAGGYAIVNNSSFEDNSALTPSNVQSFGGALRAKKNVIVGDSSFIGNTARDYGGAIYGDAITIYGSYFENNNAENDKGGAVYAESAADVINSTFIGNRANVDGGAIYAEDAVSVRNSTFKENKATGALSQCYGGAIRSEDYIQVYNSSFVGNYAEDYGGAIYADYADIYGSYFENNRADDNDGGAVFVDEMADVANSIFIGNTACLYGGAISSAGDVAVKNSTFSNNAVSGAIGQCYGGAIRSKNNVKVDNSTFRNNHAEDYGGAIYADTITWVDSPSHFTGNYAEKNAGGAIYTNKFNTDVRYAVFNGNLAKGDDDGGAIYINEETNMAFINCTFKMNSAGDEGGAIYLDSTGSTLTLINNSFVDNYAADEGQHVFNKGTYGTIKNNWWGTPTPDFSRDLLVEWKAWPWSNIHHADSDPLKTDPNNDKGIIIKVNLNLTAEYENGTITATVKNGRGHPLEGVNVSFANGGVKYITTDENGQANYSLNYLPAGNYSIKVQAHGNYLYGDSNLETVNVTKEMARIYLRNALYFVTETKMVRVTLLDGANKPLAGKTVRIAVADSRYSGVTDENGDAYIRVGVGFGVHNATVSFDGDGEYGPANRTGYIRVIKETPSVMVRYADTQFITKENPKVVKVYLWDRNSKPLPVNSKIAIKVNGETYIGYTDTNGIANVVININKIGIFRAEVLYAGNSAYNAVTREVKITVKR